MQIVDINCSKKYQIRIEKGIIENLGSILNEYSAVSKFCIITDKNVMGIYEEKINHVLLKCNSEIIYYVIEPGEKSKSGEAYLEILEFLAKNEFTRTDMLIAFGGGVVGDLAGFVAASYLRGIDFIQIPTTILAAVDSSVGGKTAINLKAGKNLAGAFHQPVMVICDSEMFNTLTKDVRRDGFAEVIKYGIINDAELFDKLSENVDIEVIIKKSVLAKAKLVEEDEFDTGSRRLLNLGHTFGHAIEIAGEYRYSHGEAVAMGIMIVSKAAVAKGYLAKNDYDKIKNLISSYEFDLEPEFTAEKLYEIMLLDKKREGKSITVVVPFAIGDSRLVKLKLEEAKEYLVEGLKQGAQWM
ncbi:MAG: 3-dehydroquinate synthase [Clostridiales bacterium]|jgi:3-dehydroquinate synthase|nr:3-dehydroquinate synthase [Clostridiales bacterium]